MDFQASRYLTSLFITSFTFGKAKDGNTYLYVPNDTVLPTSPFETRSLKEHFQSNPIEGAKDLKIHGIVSSSSKNQNNDNSFEFNYLVWNTCTLDQPSKAWQLADHTLAKSLGMSAPVCEIYSQILEGVKPQLLQFTNTHSQKKLDAPAKMPNLDLVAFVLVIQNDKILLIQEQEKKGGGYFLPAGHFENGETTQQAGIRETEEEAGYTITVSNVAQIVYFWGGYSGLHYVVSGRITGGEIKKKGDGESQKAEWFDLKTVLAETSGAIPQSIKYRKVWELKAIFQECFEKDGTLKQRIGFH